MARRLTASERLTEWLNVPQITYVGPLSELDPVNVPLWVELIDEQIAAARDLRRQLLALVDDAPTCHQCGQSMAGRRDRKFCNAACRQAAYRDGKSRNTNGQ